MKKVEDIAELLAPAVSALALELLGLEYLPAARPAVLRLYIDAPGRSVGIEDCETVSREVSALLDVHDPIGGQYVLEVSSPGIDRPLFTAEQVGRHLGAEAKFSLSLPQDGRRRLQGVIRRVEDGLIVLECEGVEWRVPFDNVEKARLVPDLAALGLAPARPEPRAGGARASGKGKRSPKSRSGPAAQER